MLRTLRAGALALGVAVVVAGCASGVSFPALTPGVTLRSELYRPSGPGPFPAMVLMHSCSGLSTAERAWADWLKSEGYVALTVESLASRGFTNACQPTQPAPGLLDIVRDAYAARNFLQSQPFVDRERIGVIGWSWGAGAAARAASA